MLLAGDVGATKTILGIFSEGGVSPSPLALATFPSRRYPGLAELVAEFLAGVDHQVQGACLAVAGPVLGGEAKLSNLAWRVSEGELAQRLGIPLVNLINDAEAMAEGIPLLNGKDLYLLKEGEEVSGGAKVVVAVGTGLGAGFLVWDGARYQAHASEGGHADFAPGDKREDALLAYLRDRYGHVSYERVCSGLGLPIIYRYLVDMGREAPSCLAQRVARADAAAAICEAALEGVEVYREAVDIFCSALGRLAGDLALMVMGLGGVYLAGGIPRRIIPLLSRPPFAHGFCSKGRLSGLMGRIPVYVVLEEKLALLGAARRGVAMLS